ncbi:hypothetical protein SRHO_G00208510 [Serrasalmus rhombeus]
MRSSEKSYMQVFQFQLDFREAPEQQLHRSPRSRKLCPQSRPYFSLLSAVLLYGWLVESHLLRCDWLVIHTVKQKTLQAS